MKTYFFILVFLFFFIGPTGSQNTYPIKEQYDKIYPTSNISPLNYNYSNCYNVGNVEENTLDIIQLYKEMQVLKEELEKLKKENEELKEELKK